MGKQRPWYHLLYDFILPFFNRGFEGLVVNANNIRKYIRKKEKVSKEKIKVIYNGISIPPHSYSIPALLKDVRSDIWIGIVANLKPIKRLDIFIQSIGHLKQKCEGIKIHAVILGEGPERERLEKIAKELNILPNIHFVGSVNNVIEYLQNIDIAVLSSDGEGLSNAILEYMACKLPVVATAVGGNPELVDSTNGFCIKPGNSQLLGDTLAMLVKSITLRKQMGDQSLKKIKSRFCWDQIISEWENYYNHLVHKSFMTRM
jgi:glycosyltransferase involved in cell wall biosynthesis